MGRPRSWAWPDAFRPDVSCPATVSLWYPLPAGDNLLVPPIMPRLASGQAQAPLLPIPLAAAVLLPCPPWFREHFRSVTWVRGPRPRTRAWPSDGRNIGGGPPVGLCSHRRPRDPSCDMVGCCGGEPNHCGARSAAGNGPATGSPDFPIGVTPEVPPLAQGPVSQATTTVPLRGEDCIYRVASEFIPKLVYAV